MKRDESQNVEYKESWHDKYLAWICGYANAQGGTIYFGIEDYAEDFINPGRRNPVLESRTAYFRIILPNMIYGFTDEQLIAAAKNPKARDATPVVTPVTTPVVPPVVPPVAPPVGRPSETLINEVQRKILQVLCNDILSTSELARKVGISQAKDVRRRYLRLLLDMGLVEYTIPNKPNSKLQQYRLTAKGSEFAERQDADHVVNGVVNVVNDVVNRGKDVVNVVNETAIADSVLDALRADSKMSAMRIASMLGVATRTVQRALKALQDAGSIRRIGGTRGRWEVT
jgi:predicted HTH transcriptional regulator